MRLRIPTPSPKQKGGFVSRGTVSLPGGPRKCGGQRDKKEKNVNSAGNVSSLLGAGQGGVCGRQPWISKKHPSFLWLKSINPPAKVQGSSTREDHPSFLRYPRLPQNSIFIGAQEPLGGRHRHQEAGGVARIGRRVKCLPLSSSGEEPFYFLCKRK